MLSPSPHPPCDAAAPASVAPLPCPGCGSNEDDAHLPRCTLPKTFRCGVCRLWVPWGKGSGDDMPGACDDCWALAHKDEVLSVFEATGETVASLVAPPALDLDAIEARDRARTQGEWSPTQLGVNCFVTEDAAFIAAASLDIPALCREVRRLRALQPPAVAVTLAGLEQLVRDLEQARGELARLRGAAAALFVAEGSMDDAFDRARLALRSLLPGSLEALAGGAATPAPEAR